MKLSTCKVVAVRNDPKRRHVLIAVEHPDADQLERRLWRLTRSQVPANGGSVRVAEAGVHRGPDWQSPSGHVVKKGSALVGLLLDATTWEAYTSGEIPPRSLLRQGAGAKKGRNQVSKRKLSKQLAAIGSAGWSAFRELELRVKKASSPGEQQVARQQLALAKMIAQDHARAGDPGATARRMRGLGEPLFTNRHELPPDADLQGI